jgi:hypothetical protein
MSTDGISGVAVAASPEDLMHLNLSVAYYPGPNRSAQGIREQFWHLQHENRILWRVRIFETASHYSSVLSSWTPDVVIAHWHGEARSGSFFDLPTQVANRLRDRREGVGIIPFLVGQFSRLDLRFNLQDPDNLIMGLLEIYDMLYCDDTIERVFHNVAIGLWNSFHARRQSKSRRPFDGDFQAYARDHRVL